MRIRKTPRSIEYAAKRAWDEVAREESRNNRDFSRIYAAYKQYMRDNQ